MGNSNTNNSDIEICNYLVTEAVNPKEIDPIQQGTDLYQLLKAEEKQQSRTTTSRKIENSKVRKAADSLRLSNPFRGI